MQDSLWRLLLHLAREFLQREQVVAAVKCYEAVIASQPLATVEVETRVELARLLLLRTANLRDATNHLLKASLKLRKLSSVSLDLRLHCSYLLAKSHQLRGAASWEEEDKHYEEICQLSTAAAESASKTTEAHSAGHVAHWICMAQLQRSRIQASIGNAAAAQELAEQACQDALTAQIPADATTALLTVLQLKLQGSGDRNSLQAAEAKLEEHLAASANSYPSAGLWRRHQLQFAVLRASAMMTRALFLPAADREASSPPDFSQAVAELERMLGECPVEQASSSLQLLVEAGEHAASGLLQGLAHLLCARMQSLQAKHQAALRHVRSGMDLAAARMSQLCGGADAPEAELAPAARLHAQPLARLLYLLHEAQAVLLLMQTEQLRSSCSCLERMQALLARFPVSLQPFAASLHLLCGCLACALGREATTLEHFRRALQLSQGAQPCEGSGEEGEAAMPEAERRARLCLAHAHLSAAEASAAPASAPGGEHGLGGAAQDAASARAALGPLLVPAVPTMDAVLASRAPVTDTLWALYLSAMCSRLQGEGRLALRLLTAGMRGAHKHSRSYQMIVLIITALAPMQLREGDGQGAERLAMSASKLSRSLQDLPMYVRALQALVEALEAGGSAPDDTVREVKRKRDSKLDQHASALKTLCADGSADAVLRWGLDAGRADC